MRAFAPVNKTVLVAVAVLAVIALSACELGLHQLEKSELDCDVAWRSGCPLTVDFTADGRMRKSRTTVDREDILDAAEASPYRRCDVFPVGCQAHEIGDVIAERYLAPL